jgi:hypothetical protein
VATPALCACRATRQELIPLPRTGGILAMHWLEYNDPSIPSTRYPLTEVRTAVDYLGTGHARAKVVVTLE